MEHQNGISRSQYSPRVVKTAETGSGIRQQMKQSTGGGAAPEAGSGGPDSEADPTFHQRRVKLQQNKLAMLN